MMGDRLIQETSGVCPREGFVTPTPPQKVCETQILNYCNFVYIVTSLKRLV